MSKINTLAVVAVTSLIAACSSAPSTIYAEAGSSIAMQVVAPFGVKNTLKDQSAPDSALQSTSLVGHTVAGVLGGALMPMMVTGIMGKDMHGWEYTNYVMYVDASKYSINSKEEAGRVALEKMASANPITADMVKQLTGYSVTDTNLVKMHRYNGGAELFQQGYSLYDSEEENAFPYFTYREDGYHAYFGYWLNVKQFTPALDVTQFSPEIRKHFPHTDKVVGIRFGYTDSLMRSDFTQTEKETGSYATAKTQPYSVDYKLPQATYLSFPQRVPLGKDHAMTFGSVVRDNNNAYYFVKPKNDKQVSMSMTEFSEMATKKASEIVQ